MKIKPFKKPNLPKKIKNCKLIIPEERFFPIEKVYLFNSKSKKKLYEWGDEDMKYSLPGKEYWTGYFPINKQIALFRLNNWFNNKEEKDYKITGWYGDKIYYELEPVFLKGERGNCIKFSAGKIDIDRSRLK